MATLLAVTILALLLTVWWRMQPAVRVDPPRSLLAAALGWLPADRADWGRAMLAELDRVEGRSARWWFALGCARAAVQASAAASRLRPAGALVIAAAAVALGLGLFAISSQLLVFAAVLAAELAACCWLAWVRPRGGAAPGQASAGRAMRAGVLAGVAACIGLSAFGVMRYPVAGHDLARQYWVLFATLLTAYVWLSLVPPRSPAPAGPAGRYGLIGAAALSGLWLIGLGDAILFGHHLFSAYVLAATLLTFLLVGRFAGRSSGRADVGAAIGLWSALAGALSLFVIGMVATYATVTDAPPAHAVQVVTDNLAYLIAMLLALPVIGPTLTLMGSMRGARRPHVSQ